MGKREYQCRRALRLLPLHLYHCATLFRLARNNHQVTTLLRIVALHDLANWTHSVDYRRSCRVGHKCRQRLQCAPAIRLVGQCKRVLLPGLKAGDCRLEYLSQALVKQRYTGGRFPRCLINCIQG